MITKTAKLEVVKTTGTISKQEVSEVRQWHIAINTSLLKAISIGERLTKWKVNIPDGKWLDWLGQNIPELSQESVSVYTRIWESRLLLEKEFKFKLTNAANIKELPSINKAIITIRNAKNNKPRGKPKTSKNSISRTSTNEESGEEESKSTSARPAGNGSRMARNDVALKLSDFDKELEELLGKYVKSLKGVTLVNEAKSIADRWLKKQVLFKKAA